MLARSVGNRIFTGLSDVPSSYSGQANHIVRVSDAEDGVEFSNLPYYVATDYGIIADGQQVIDGAITAGDNALTSAEGLFSADIAGKTIVVTGAGAGGGQFVSTVATFVSSIQILLSTNAVTTVSGANVSWGTPNDTALRTLIDSIDDVAGGGVIIFPVGRYFFYDTARIYVRKNVVLKGHLSGPGEGGYTNPGRSNTLGATFMVTNITDYFMHIKDNAAVLDLVFYYPNQVRPTESTPISYPYTLYVDNGTGGAKIRNNYIANAYQAIKYGGARGWIQDNMIGALYNNLYLEGSRDFSIIDNNFFQIFYDIVYGYGYGQTIDTWVMNNSIGVIVGSYDYVNITNLGMFKRNTGFLIDDSVTITSPYSNSYGSLNQANIDSVKYGFKVKSTNPTLHTRWELTNVSIGSDGTGVNAIWLQSGGSSAPKVTWNSGYVWGTFATPIKVDAGEIQIAPHVKGAGDIFNPFANADTTPSVSAGNFFLAANTSPTTITSFDNGYDGQEIEVLHTTANTTYSETGNIKLMGVSTLTPAVNDLIKLRRYSSNWFQVGGGGGGGGGDIDGGAFSDTYINTSDIDGGAF